MSMRQFNFFENKTANAEAELISICNLCKEEKVQYFYK